MEWNDDCFDVGNFMGKWGLLGKIGVSVEIEQRAVSWKLDVVNSLKYAPPTSKIYY